MEELTRRDALAGATALGAVAVAGCVASDDSTDEPENQTGPESNAAPDSADSSGSSLELRETSIETTETNCGSGDMVEASVTDGDLLLSGKLPVGNPCHEALLDVVTLESGVLSVSVRAESSSEACTSCTGVVDYEGTLTFSQELSDLSAFDSVTVDHGGTSGETHVVEEAGVVSGQVSRGGAESSGEDPQSTVLADSVVTTSRDCTGNIPPSSDPERVGADEETEFSRSDGTVTVEGAVTASTPCHEAYIENVDYTDGQVSLVVGVRSNLDEDELCTECLAEIRYRATVEIAEAATVSDVSVTHIEAAG